MVGIKVRDYLTMIGHPGIVLFFFTHIEGGITNPEIFSPGITCSHTKKPLVWFIYFNCRHILKYYRSRIKTLSASWLLILNQLVLKNLLYAVGTFLWGWGHQKKVPVILLHPWNCLIRYMPFTEFLHLMNWTW